MAVRGVSLNKKKLEGGWGEGAAPPPRCIGCCCICSCCISCFVLPFFPNSYVLCFLVLRVFLEERCGGERSHP